MPARPYPRPPIQEALVELRFVDDGRWNWTWPGRFWEVVKSEYDGEPRTEQALSVSAHPQARTLTTRAVTGVGRVFLTRTGDPGLLLALAPSAMSVHVLRPYPGWSSFRPRVVAAIEAHQQLQAEAQVARIGVRYVNHIVLPGDNLDLADWFTSSPTLPEGVGPAMAALMSRVETIYDDGARLAITLATVQHDKPGEQAFLLDLDLSWNAPEPLPLTDRVYDVIEHLHDREGTAFEAMITDATRERFR